MVVLVYVAFFGRIVFPEFSLKPGWVRQFDGSGVRTEGDFKQSIPCRFSGYFGYFLPDGTILYSGKTLYGTAVDTRGFVNYSSINSGLLVRYPDGSVRGIIGLSGYPLFRGGERFMLSADENTLTFLDEQDQPRWHITFNSLITAVSVADGYVLTGTLNDGAVLLDTEGKKLFAYTPKAGRINIVYGVRVSPAGKNLLIVSGIDPQVVTLFKRHDNEYRREYSLRLGTALRHPVMSVFSRDGKTALIERENSIMLLDIPGRNLVTIPLGGTLYSFIPGDSRRLLYTASGADGVTDFAAFTQAGMKVFSFSLSGNRPFMEAVDSSLYVGIGTRLMRLDMVEQ